MDALANPRIGWVKVENVGKKYGQCNQGYCSIVCVIAKRKVV